MARLGGETLAGARMLHLDAIGFGPGDRLARGVRLVALGLAGRLDGPLALAACLVERGAGRIERGLDLRQAPAGSSSSLSTARCCVAISSRRTLRRRRRSCSSAISRLMLLRSASSSAIWRVSRSCSVSAADRGLVRFVARLLGGGGAIVFADAILLELDPLGIEIGDGGIGIALAALLAREIALGLLQAGLGVLLGGGNALGFGVERIVRRAQALQGRGGGRLVVAQWRQRGRGVGLRSGGKPDETRQVGDLRLRLPSGARQRRPVPSRHWRACSASTAASARRIWSDRLR